LGEEGGLNLYGFVNNDPNNVVDPYGLYGEIVIDDGQVIPVPDSGALLDALLNAVPGAVSSITFSGHAGPDGIFFSGSEDDFLTSAGSKVSLGGKKHIEPEE
jgi:hypothetical protein